MSTTVDPPGGGADLDVRVTRLEQDMLEVKGSLGQITPLLVRIDAMLTATLPHLATKAELADLGSSLRTELHAEVGALRTELQTETGELRTLLQTETGAVRTLLHTETGALRRELHAETGALRSAIARLPSRTELWGMLTLLIAAYAAGLAGLAFVLK